MGQRTGASDSTAAPRLVNWPWLHTATAAEHAGTPAHPATQPATPRLRWRLLRAISAASLRYCSSVPACVKRRHTRRRLSCAAGPSSAPTNSSPRLLPPADGAACTPAATAPALSGGVATPAFAALAGNSGRTGGSTPTPLLPLPLRLRERWPREGGERLDSGPATGNTPPTGVAGGEGRGATLTLDSC